MDEFVQLLRLIYSECRSVCLNLPRGGAFLCKGDHWALRTIGSPGRVSSDHCLSIG
jgi:hypothetical protein